MNENCQLSNICVECHFDMLPFPGRRLNLMLLLPSHAGTHSAAPFFSLSRKGSLHFTASSSANSHWIDMKFCSLSEQILLFNPAIEIAWHLQQNKRYDVLKFGLCSSAKFTWKMSTKSFISYATVFIIQFSFKLYS